MTSTALRAIVVLSALWVASCSKSDGGAGGPTCTAGQKICSGACVDVMGSDGQNCGDCGKVCGAGQACQSGTCRCQTGLVLCGTACVSSDVSNCGSCGNRCQAEQVCSNGVCGSDAGTSGAAGTTGQAGRGGSSGTAGSTGTGGALAKFSFFVTSVGALRTLSGSQDGFGGDLRYGETGDGAGLRGADKICTAIAEMSMPGSAAKGWRAFLSAPAMGSSAQVNAIDRIGNGPWYDRKGRLVSSTKANLLAFRPVDADAAIKNDLPNETGTPNHSDGAPGCTGNSCPDNHDTLTGTGEDGKLYTGTANASCSGWTTAVGSAGKPHVGHCWPRSATSGGGGISGGGPGGAFGDGGMGVSNYGHWISSLDEAGCAPGVSLQEMGPPNPNNPTVGSGGGYGGFYCFALTP